MPLYLIERNFAEERQRKSYCLYEADSVEDLQEEARRLAIPADVIVEVGEVNSAMFT